ncbi:MAG TPA: SDR family NAD(P)-dependent oxidoreductase [Humidesulfovibrio sp.]|uniref:SDR family NAD(P)-dependent oxidoreductase n=1 Tax=Humidesulfovibrio sp. TaxID=2910988 RepID=UPI002C5B45DD|nr:SDR family NAD(P)-dependent oxidoreductase [Humidesulfovibrio sp.]HWR03513.1 SDR family NAD(P)-dependent oxidoreductase [Humidesulfovibrio sp.]
MLLDALSFSVLPAQQTPSDSPLFVEYHPGQDALAPDRLRDALAQHAAWTEVVLVTADVDFAASLAGTASAPAAVALKSCEAAGTGSTESAGILLDYALRRLNLPVLIWGGIATPEAASAFLATGAAGVVIEHAHWLTADLGLEEGLRAKLRTLKTGMSSTVSAGPGLQWRFFDKGNSRAVRKLRALSATAADEATRLVSGEAKTLGSSALGSDELTPCSTEAAFASIFAQRFGPATGPALERFAAETLRLMGESRQRYERFLRGPAAQELGCGLPVIQGGMSWISDKPAFARAVAEAGALPTLAVGMRTAAQMDRDFGELERVMGGRPYAMNVLVLEENPHRAEQLAWLDRHRPPFVVVAAGDPSFAGQLHRQGHQVIYLAADPELLRLALKAGVRFVVLEGCEAGGHVGRQTLLELAQAALCLRWAEPELFREARVVLAGGVCDGPSALRAALLGADAVQMGTAYLATREIVDTGALSAVYQREILAANLGATRISGESVGLRVRSLDTPKVRAICRLEQERGRGERDEASFRRELESLSVGSLLVAARNVRIPGGDPLPPQVCQAEGQFMSGAVAGNITGLKTLAELHAALVAAAPANGLAAPRRHGIIHERIAVTGMAMVNSLGQDTDAIIQASLEGRSGISTVPRARWDHSVHLRPGQTAPNTTYTDVGAFMEVDCPRKSLGVSPQDYRTMSLSTKLTLLLGRRAVEAAGLAGSLVPGSRVAVLTSQNSAEVASTVRGQLFTTYADDIGEIVWRALELTPEQRAAVVREVAKEGLNVDDTTLIGRLNCTASGHLCNMFGFGGPSYSVGAACASSLIALYNAVLLMRAGIIDAAVVGGGEELLTPAHYLEFSALRALAGLGGGLRSPQEHSRPFDKDREGFVLGEGGAVVVLERESVARGRGAPIHAFITGVGACTNHQGIVESVAEAQLVALNAAQDDAGYGLEAVDLVECHGTSTVQGDREEVRALASLAAESRRPVVLSSFKSQVGHTLGASGLSSLIRGIGAMRRGYFPPTNNYRQADPALPLDEAGFRVLTRAEAWPAPEERPRRMQVNAFGFGGACVVVHVEGPEGEPDIPCELREPELGGQSSGVDFRTVTIGGRDYRAGLCAPSAAAADLLRGQTAEGLNEPAMARLARKGVFLGAADEPREPLALIFSGQGSFYRGMGREITRAFPLAAQQVERLSACADYDLKALLFDAGEEQLRLTRWQQPALFTLQMALAAQLQAFGLRPDAVAGHSLGEFAALCVAGVLDLETAFRIVDTRARLMAKAAEQTDEPGSMAAVALPLDVLEWRLAKHPGVVVTNYNTPRQIVVGGETARVQALVEELKAKGETATMLKVSMAFHSPRMRVIRDEFAAFLAGQIFTPPTIPVVSNVLKGPFPQEPEQIREIMVQHLETPVHWTQNVYYLWSELGVRRFVEVGPGAVLGNLVRDICPEARTLGTASREDETGSFNAALAALYAWGGITPGAEPRRLDLGREGQTVAAAHAAPASQPVRDILERTIGIIMEATGYERDEIEPDMDLRQDLAIRSSRLPVIMDMAERAFGLTIRIEDFIGVQTVRQMAERVESLAGSRAPAPLPDAPRPLAAHGMETGGQEGGFLPVARCLPVEAPFAAQACAQPEGLAGMALMVAGGGQQGGALAHELGQTLGMRPLAADLGSPLPGEDKPAGLVLLAEGCADADPEESLAQIFLRLKEFVSSGNKRFCALVQPDSPHGTPERVLFEGALGMLLTLAQEYQSVRCLCLRLAPGVAPGAALLAALETCGPVERLVRPDAVLTPQFVPAAQPEAGAPVLRSGDVLVASGGASGVTLHLLKALAPLGLRLVLLGRRPADEAVSQALDMFAALGSQAEYIACDVAQRPSVAEALASVAQRHGRIDAVLHGAGLLRDKFLALMSEEDLRQVVRVKFHGLRNLVEEASARGLRLVCAFSSVAAWQGNVGQANYCAGNRAMASFLCGLASAGTAARVLWLPPVGGVGMASGEDIRSLMTRKGMGDAYVDIEELTPLFARELAFLDAASPSVLLARFMPETDTVLRTASPADEAEAGLRLPTADAPLLDEARLTGLSPLSLLATRRLSHERDLWLPEHRPYLSLSAPLFSTVMAVEAFHEAARVLLPHLSPVVMENLRLLDMLPCPQGESRNLRFTAGHVGMQGAVARVEVRLESQDVSPRGRALDRWTVNSEACVLLGGAPGRLEPGDDFASGGFSSGKGLSAEDVLRVYEQGTGQTGRYRVLERVDGSTAHSAAATMRYRLSQDVAGNGASLRTSPYLLEGLMQLVLMHRHLHGAEGGPELLPVGIRRIVYGRPCADGEVLSLRARLREDAPRLQLWDACGFDAQGEPLLLIQGLCMQAFAAE